MKIRLMGTAPAIPGPVPCDRPATRVVEAFSADDGRLYGSLDQDHYVCAAHVEAAVAGIEAAGFAAHRPTRQVPLVRRCGEVFDYTAATDPDLVLARQFAALASQCDRALASMGKTTRQGE